MKIVTLQDEFSSTAYINEMNDNVKQMAVNNLKDALAGEDYTGPEKIAMVVFEELRLVNGLDLASVLLKGERLKRIREMNLAQQLPGEFQSMEEAVTAWAKISPTQQSVITNLYEHVFPYIRDQLQMSVQEFWEDISLSNAGEIIPHLRMLITGEPSRSGQVREKVGELLETANALGMSEEEAIENSVIGLISLGAGTVSDVRKELRPEGSPTIEMALIYANGKTFILGEVDEDQLTLLRRTFGRHVDLYNHTEDLNTLPVFKKLTRR
jgi:hypothetical protein